MELRAALEDRIVNELRSDEAGGDDKLAARDGSEGRLAC